MANGVSTRDRRSQLPVIATALALAVALTGCSLLNGSSSDEGDSDGGKEKKTIKVSVMKTTDTAPFHLARQKGYFKKEGLDVKYVDAKSGGDSLNKLISGEADIAYSGYVPALLLENKGAAKSKGGMKIVADASSAGPGSTIVMGTPSSSVKSVKDMAGKKVAVNEIGGMSDLLVKSALKTNGVSYKKIKWVSTPFPAVAQTLKSKNVDAAFATEPFIQAAMKKASAKQVFDTATGPTKDFPVGSWESTGNFTKKNPKTVAAFQRAMQRATNLARSDRAAVDSVLVKYSGVDKDSAKLAKLLTFQSKLDATRIQRVPDLMHEFKQIKTRMKVKSMIVPTASLE